MARTRKQHNHLLKIFCAGKTLGIRITVINNCTTRNYEQSTVTSESELPPCTEELCCEEEEPSTEDEACTEEESQGSGKRWNIPDTY